MRWEVWARRDLNPQPMDYESTALTVELQARIRWVGNLIPIVHFSAECGFHFRSDRKYTNLSGCHRITNRTENPRSPGSRDPGDVSGEISNPEIGQKSKTDRLFRIGSKTCLIGAQHFCLLR